MGPAKHLAAGAVAGALMCMATRDPIVGMFLCTVSVVIDMDHAAEYVVYCIRHKKKPEWAEFSKGSYFQKKGTIMVAFHGYEYAAVLLTSLMVCILLQSHAALYIGAVLAGYLLHIILDVLSNDFRFKGYSLIYRASMRFSEEILCAKSRSRYKED